MLDTHPVVAVIWNFFPLFLIFPDFIRWIGNFVLFIPNIFLRPMWMIWNTIMAIPYLIFLVMTFLLTG